jgi:hypothetical protein
MRGLELVPPFLTHQPLFDYPATGNSDIAYKHTFNQGNKKVKYNPSKLYKPIKMALILYKGIKLL